MDDNDTIVLVPFLRNLADKLESKNLLPTQVQRIGEFFMTYQFNEETPSEDEEDFSRDDMLKFFVLGWYIYRNLLNNNSD